MLEKLKHLQVMHLKANMAQKTIEEIQKMRASQQINVKLITLVVDKYL